MSPEIEVFEQKTLLTGNSLTFTVNVTADTVDANIGDGLAEDGGGNTSLRAAIQEANAVQNAVDEIIINVPAGTYQLALSGNDDAAAVGDLDITNALVPITIRGAGMGITTFDGNGIDRLFHVLSGADLTIEGATVTNGDSGTSDGGGLLNAGRTTVVRTEFTTNTTQSVGGAIATDFGASLNVFASSFVSNSADFGSGAINNNGELIVDASTFRLNSTTGASAGAIGFGNSTATITRSLFDTNSAATDGGAISITNGNASISNTTFTGNTAASSGAAIRSLTSTVDLSSSTFDGNVSSTATGFFANGGTVTVQNTVFGGTSTEGVQFSGGTFTSLGSNFVAAVQTGQGFTNGVNNDQVGSVAMPLNAMLGTLADNGGPTLTILPQAMSPLIDNGSNVPAPFSGPPLTDQRGATRVNGTQDIGAVETGFTGFFVNTLTDTVDANVGDGSALDASMNTSLRAAIQEASSQGGNRVVVLTPGVYKLALAGANEDSGATGDLDITGDIVLQGFGRRASIIDGSDLDRVLHVSSSVTSAQIAELTITNGQTTGGSSGAGLLTEGVTLLQDVDVIDNVSGLSGGGIASAGTLTIERSTIRGNTAQTTGGGLGLNGTTTIRESFIVGNSAVLASGGIGVDGTLDITNSTVFENTATTGPGGGIGVSPGGQLNMTDSVVRENTSDSDGAGLALMGMANVVRSSITENSVTGSGAGGGVAVDGAEVTFVSVSVANNSATSGGGLAVKENSTVSLDYVTVDGNRATTLDGGGLSSIGGTLSIRNSTISNNEAAGSGGGVATAAGSGTNGSIDFLNTTISTNTAGVNGGGIAIAGTSSADLPTVSFLNSTITQNTALTGGGVSSGVAGLMNPPVTLANTIVAANSASTAPDIFGSARSGGNNLIGVGEANFTNGINGDIVGTAGTPTDPKLGPLQNNGGGIDTHALLAGSPAIDAGNDALVGSVVTDQRGATRQISTVDIGAYEDGFVGFFVNSNVDAVDANPGDGVALDANGDVTLRAAIQEANALTGTQNIVVSGGNTVSKESSYQQAVLGDSPAVYLKFDEASGTTFADSSGNGFSGTSSGMTAPMAGAEGHIRRGADFDGALTTADGDQVQVAHNATINLTRNFSLEAWVKPDAVNATPGPRVIVSKAQDDGLTGVNLSILDGIVRMSMLRADDSNFTVASSQPIAIGRFSHVVGTYDGRIMNIYVDGQLAGTLDTGSVQDVKSQGTPQPLVIGREFPTAIPDRAFDGVIDEVAVYQSVLSSTAVAQHFDAGSSSSISGEYGLDLAGAGEDSAATGDLDITDSVNIQGQGAASTTFDGRDLDRVLDIKPGSTVMINDVSIINGRAATPADDDGGGARLNDATVDFNRVEFRNNSATNRGGAIYTRFVGAATTRLTDSNVDTNTASQGGGLYTDSDAVIVTRTAFRNNMATINGSEGGGAIFALEADVTITDSELSANFATGADGGAIYIQGSGETINISNSAIVSNNAQFGGGGIVNDGQTLNLTGSDLVNNNALDGSGGGLRNVGTANITSTLVQGNNANGVSMANGAGIFGEFGSTTTITESVVKDNNLASSFGFGAGIYSESVLNVVRSEVSSNIGGDGAGIYTSGTANITNTTVSGNNAGPMGSAGGIAVGNGTTTILNSTITANAGENGGGLANSGTVNLKNTIIAGNTSFTATNADVSGSIVSQGNNLIGDKDGATGVIGGVNGDIVGGETGVAIQSVTGATPIQISSTSHGLVTGDSVRITGVSGVAAANGTFVVTVVDANNFTLDGTSSAGSSNDGMFFKLVDPKLGPLQNNSTTPALNEGDPPIPSGLGMVVPPEGVPFTNTHALLMGSPAIDTGTDIGAPVDDQRNISRPIDGDNNATATTDIGAVEFFYTTVAGKKFSDIDGDGIQDPGEPGVPGILMYVDLNQNGRYDSGEPFAMTEADNPLTTGVDETGDYLLSLVPAGSVVVSEDTSALLNPARITTPRIPVLGTPNAQASVVDPNAIAFGDLDGDGSIDIVTTRPAANSIQIEFNPNAPSSSTATIAAGTDPRAIAVVDLDGDSLLDIVVTSGTGNSVGVLRNLGTSGFAALVSTAVGTNPESLTVGDFDGDNDLDIATANSGSNNVTVLQNTGGTLNVLTTVAVGMDPADIVAVDFDRDGMTDFATSDFVSNEVSIVFNDGGGTFTRSAIAVSGGPENLVADDFDRDGFFDVAVSAFNSNEAKLLRGIGNRSFALSTVGSVTMPGPIGSQDLNSDGYPELIVLNQDTASQLEVFQNDFDLGGGLSIKTTFAAGTNVEDFGFTVIDSVLSIGVISQSTDDIRSIANLTGSQNPTTQTGVPLTGLNFGNQELGTVTGIKFHDRNRNGIIEPGEEPLAGVTVYLDFNENGRFDAEYEQSAVTDMNGVYTIAGVIPDDYLVGELVPNGFFQASPNDIVFSDQEIGMAGENAVDSVTADLNNDGNLDLIVLSEGNLIPGQVDVFMGTGSNVFNLVETDSVGMFPVALEIGDLDGDNDLDLIVVNSGDNNFTILENTGSAFNALTPIAAPDSPSSISLADIDGDMDLDIAIGKEASAMGAASVAFYTNTGSLTFAAPVTVGTGGMVSSVLFADLDLDGDQDLVATDFDQDEFAVLRNDGGTFSVATQVATGDGPLDVVVLDVDQAGAPDIFVAVENDTAIAQHIATGLLTYSAGSLLSVSGPPESLALLDADDDGDLDLAATGSTSLTVIENNGFAFGSTTTFNTGPGTEGGLSVGDFDNDGLTDIVAPLFLAGGDNVAVLFNRQGMVPINVVPAGSANADFGNIQAASISGTKFEDLNENGVQDMGELGLSGFRIFIDENSNGRYDVGEQFDITAGDGTYTISNVDAAIPQVVLEELPATYRQTAPSIPGVKEVVSRFTGDDPHAVELGDVNGDGLPDIVVANTADSSVTVVITEPVTGAGIQRTFAAGGQAEGLVLIDVDGDLDLDIVTANGLSNTISVLKNDGSGSFAAPITGAAGNEPRRIAVGDFDGDSDLDLLVTNEPQTQLTQLINNGTGGFASRTIALTNDPVAVTAVDIDRDGDIDAAATTIASNTLVILLNDGTGTLTPQAPVALSAATSDLANADIDNDGDIDLLAVSANDLITLTNSGGSFTATTTFVGSSVSDLVVVDFDADGDQDVVANASMSARFMQNDGGGSFSNNPLGVDTFGLDFIAVGDLNQDNRVDLVGTRASSDLAVAFINATGVQQVTPFAGQAVTGIDFGNRLFNLAPMINGPVSATVNEDNDLTFDGASLFTINDSDAAAGVIETKVTVTNGTIKLGSTAGITILSGANESATVTFESTLANANSAINAMIFSPAADFFGNATLTIDVDDRGNTGAGGAKQGSISSAITVQPINDAPDIDNGQQATYSIDENPSANDAVFSVVHSDVDSVPADLSFSFLSGNTNNAFAIDNAGNVTVNDPAQFDAEVTTQFTLNIQLRDDSAVAPTPLFDTMVFTVNVNNLNDNDPVVTAAQSFAIDENLSNMSAVGTIVATDADAGTTFQDWTIVSGNTGGAFALDASSGQLTVANSAALDREVRSSFSLVVTVSDGERTSAQETVVVNLNDVNEFTPAIDADQMFDIDENPMTGASVGVVTAADSDATAVLQNWSITGGNTNNAFTIDANTGEITIQTPAEINAEVTAQYTLTLTVSDGTNTSSAQTVTIDINDVNEFTPVVNAGQMFNVDENSAMGTAVGTVTGSDADLTGVLQNWTITGGNTGNAFAIDGTTGAITVQTPSVLDAEVNPLFTLTVTVSDGTNTSAAQTVTINLNDINEFTPLVDAGQSFSVDENSAAMTAVGTVTGDDLDATATLQNWMITGGNTGNAFAIDANTGAITVQTQSALDAETKASFTLTITVSDGTNTSAAETVTININDVNEFAPAIDGGQFFDIDENSAAMTVVGTPTAQDGDLTATLSNWLITGGNTGNAFQINAVTGQISVQTPGALDAEVNPTFNLMLTVSDGTNTSAVQTVQINLNDINEFTPSVLAGQTFLIDENTANGVSVGFVAVQDNDVEQNFQNYQIVGGNTGNAFAIDSNTGEITVNTSTVLDAEMISSFTLQVRVSDNDFTSAAEDVVIDLDDVNDNLPSVDAGQTFAINENLANGSVVGTLTATDLDVTAMLSNWTITGGNVNNAFALNAATGQITVNNVAALDREARAGFTLMVTVSDGTNTSAVQNVAIDLNDVNEFTPVIDSNQTFNIPEDAAMGDIVGTATAVDQDATAVLSNWMITAGNTGNAFAINSATGLITVQTPGQLDAEDIQSYQLTLTVSDGTNVSMSRDVTIDLDDVNEFDPSVDPGQMFFLNENSPNNVSVGFVSGFDEDVTAVLTDWSINGGNTNGAFSIDSITGQIVVVNSAALDAETTPVFNLDISVSDGEITSMDETVQVVLTDLNDNDPSVDAGQSFDINENLANGSTVGTLTGTDLDITASLSNWTIVSGNVGNAFSLNPSTGVITVNDVTALDREVRAGFNLMVTVSDGTKTSPAESVAINLLDVNEFTPVIAPGQVVNVAENSTAFPMPVFVMGSDQDATSVLQNWQIVTGLGNDGGNTGNAFAINSATGEITIQTPAALDAETNPVFNLMLNVSDGMNISSTTIFAINLDDVNEFTPVIADEQAFFVDENSPAGTVVGSVFASDEDQTAVLQDFTITGGNTGGAFDINASTGEITVADTGLINLLDFETTTQFTLTITVSDGVNTSSDVDVDVLLNDLNDNIPQVTAGQAFNVAENSNVGTVVGTVVATDLDADTTFSNWTIQSGNVGGAFAIDANTGQITVANSAPLDREVRDSIELMITVSDGANASLNQAVTINIDDVNEFVPTIGGGQMFVINENSAANVLVGTVSASDQDATAVLTNWTITAGNTGSAFSIGANSGEIRVLTPAALNAEANTLFTLTLTVSDGVNTSMSQTVDIDILDVNEFAPVITPGQSFNLDENPMLGQSVGTVAATDADETGALQDFAITSGNTGNAFKIDEETGELTVDNPSAVNFETSSSFNLVVSVSDGQNTVNEDVTITVNDLLESFVVEARDFDMSGGITIKREGSALRAVNVNNVDVVPQMEFTSATDIAVMSGVGTQSLTIDFSGGNPIPTGGLFAANSGELPDQLIFGVNSSTTFTDVLHTLRDGTSGNFDFGNFSVNYLGFELTDALPATNRSFQLDELGENDVRLADNTNANDDLSRLELGLAGHVDFLHPTNLNIAGNSNNNRITLDVVDFQFDSQLNIDGRSGDDMIDGRGFMTAMNGPIRNFNATGGAGADTIDDGPGNDNLDGAAGNDVISAILGNNSVLGGDDDDTVTIALNGNQVVDGGLGSNMLATTAANLATARYQFGDITTISSSVDDSTFMSSYEGFNGVEDNSIAIDRSFRFDDIIQSITLAPSVQNSSELIQSAEIGTLSYNPVGSVEFEGGSQNDDIVVFGFGPSFASDLMIDGRGGADSVNLPGGLASINSDAEITAETVDVGGNINLGTGNLQINGQVALPNGGNFQANNIAVTNAQLGPGSPFVFNGDANLQTIDAQSAVSFNNAATITGNSIFAAALSVTEDATLDATDFGGLSSVGGTLTLNGSSVVRNNLSVGNQFLVRDDLEILGNVDATNGTQIGNVGLFDVQPVRVTGTGSLSGDALVQDGATLAPGLSPGQLGTQNIEFQAGSTLEIELNGPQPNMGYDQLVVNGTVNLGGATLAASLGYDPDDETFVIISNDGTDAVVGTFDGLPEGTGFDIPNVTPAGGTHRYVITYQGGDGNDVELFPVATISGRVFDDDNATVSDIGLEFDDENAPKPGVKDVSVELIRTGPAGVTIVSSTTTDANGDYTLLDILAGDYSVRFNAPDGRHFTLPDAGNNDAIDSDPSQLSGIAPLATSVLAGDRIFNVDAGLVTTKISVSDAESVLEGADGVTTPMSFTVNLNGRSPHVVTAEVRAFEVMGGATLGDDFEQFAGGKATVTFQPGQTSQTVSLLVNGDDLGNANGETDEVLEVRLQNASQAMIDDGIAQGVIIDDDPENPTVVLSSVANVIEGNPLDSSFLPFQAQLITGAINQDIILDFEIDTAASTATAGANADYIATSGQVTIPAGQTSVDIPIEVIPDRLVETNETVVLRLTGISGGNAVLKPFADEDPSIRPSTVGQILNDDLAGNDIKVSVGDTSVLESSEPNLPVLEFPVTLNATANEDVVVKFQTIALAVDGAATPQSAGAAGDFISQTGQVRIPRGQNSAVIRVPVVGDGDVEANEVVALELQEVTSSDATIDRGLAVGTIINDDFDTQLLGFALDQDGAIDSPSVNEGRLLQVSDLEFTLELNGPAPGAVTAFVSTLDVNQPGFATVNDGDFTPLISVPVVIPAGQTSANFSVDILGDERVESDEELRVRIDRIETANGANVAIDATRAQASGFVINDDIEAPTVFLNGDVTVRELDDPFNSVAEFSVELDSIASAPLEVTLEVIDLSDMDGAGGALPAAGLATIGTDSEPGADVEIERGPDGAIRPSTVTLAPGSRKAVFQVPIFGDDEVEGPESFFVRIVRVQQIDADGNRTESKVVIDPTRRRAKGTIKDNDDAIPEVSIQKSASVIERHAGGISSTQLTLALTSAIPTDVTVAVSTPAAGVNGYATRDVDFVGFQDQITIPAGSMTATVTAIVLGDDIPEPDEIFNVQIDSIVTGNATIDNANRTSTVTIVDNDIPANELPTVSITDAFVVEGDPIDDDGDALGDSDLVFVVSIDGPIEEQVSVKVETLRFNDTETDDAPAAPAGVAISDGDPVARDFFRTERILQFDPTVTTQEFRVRVRPDDRFEPDELVFARLSNPMGLTISRAQGTGTISNDDPEKPTLSISDAQVFEGDSPSENSLVFSVSLDSDPELMGREVTVGFTTIDDSARAGEDYTAVNGTLTFAVGETTKTVTVPIIGNMTDEPNKRLAVRLDNAVNAEIDKASQIGEGLIINDDSPNVELRINSVTGFEGDDGTTSFEFTVTRIGKSSNPVSVDFATKNDTAEAGEDYIATSGTLTFQPDDPNDKTIVLQIIADTDEDAEFESFFVDLTNAVNADIAPNFAQGVGVIQDEDNRVARDLGDRAFRNVIGDNDLLERLKRAIDAKNEAEVIAIKRQILQDAGLQFGLVVFADPVDLLLEDTQSRTIGYTDARGEVTENARAYYSGDDTNELIIIPEAPTGVYDLTLSGVGSGEFRTAATLITSEGAKSITDSSTLTGDLKVSLDFNNVNTPIPSRPATAVGELAIAIANQVNGNSSGDSQAISQEAAQAIAMLGRSDSANQDAELPPAVILGEAFNNVSQTARALMQVLQQTLLPGLSDNAKGNDDPPNTDPDGKKDDETPLDEFFLELGQSLLGVPGAVFDLNVFDLLDQAQEENAEVKGETPDSDAKGDEQNPPPADGDAGQADRRDQPQSRERAESGDTKSDSDKKETTAGEQRKTRPVVFRRTDQERQQAFAAPSFFEDLAKLAAQQQEKQVAQTNMAQTNKGDVAANSDRAQRRESAPTNEGTPPPAVSE